MTKDELENVLLTKSREAVDADYTASALELNKWLVRLFPENPRYKVRYADKLREVGRFEDAKAALLSLVDVPFEMMAYYEISVGLLYQETGNNREAEEHFKRATELRSNDTGPWILYGAVLIGQGKFEAAQSAYERALQCEGDVDEAHLNLGNLFRAMGKYESALEQYRLAAAICPDDADIQRALGDVETMMKTERLLAPILEEFI
jgi:tetratricopeptide (TPR) repeat protein